MAATKLELIENRRSELQAAFLAFGSVSEQLSGAFESLRGQVSQLRAELGEAQAGRDHLAARLSALIKGLPGGVLVLDGRAEIQECNPAASALLGEPLVGLPFSAARARAAVEFCGIGEHTELRSGKFVNISRRELENGGEVVLLTDVTESHLMQVFLTRQQRLLTLGELAAGLAHQIRTPLAAALLYASQMSLPERNPADQARCAEKTVHSLKQLDKLVNDMLAFTHGGATREAVSVSALLEQVAQWLRPALREGVRLTITTQAPDLLVRASAPSLVSAVLNLATNALQASSGELNLELLARRTPQGKAQIVVSDSGPGVPASIRERIFEPFFTTRARGNGIGLSIVKSVIEAHGGTISLADSYRGATFVIELPAEENA
ncbi:MAG: two-component system, sensor histidine kinase FlrB [Gammaproteobacteria bacterium]|jgi:two-component system sensor histidine kinase FlrB|nr:two-component system, sensor histidine kinase FlrB [Gammaproteobacteria bacterium]